MNVRRLFVSAIGLPLLAALGCGPKHTPVSMTVVVPSQAGAPPQTEASSVLVEKGAALIFEAAPGSPPDTTLEVQFLKHGVVKDVCAEGATLEHQGSVTCHPKITGDFDISITETSGGKRHAPQPEVKAYIRPCTGCTS